MMAVQLRSYEWIQYCRQPTKVDQPCLDLTGHGVSWPVESVEVQHVPQPQDEVRAVEVEHQLKRERLDVLEPSLQLPYT